MTGLSESVNYAIGRWLSRDQRERAAPNENPSLTFGAGAAPRVSEGTRDKNAPPDVAAQ